MMFTVNQGHLLKHLRRYELFHVIYRSRRLSQVLACGVEHDAQHATQLNKETMREETLVLIEPIKAYRKLKKLIESL